MSLVEYHDPDGLFPLISPQLLARLPLRNLHWKSPSRPLRSIASLHVDFVPAAGTEGSKASHEPGKITHDGRHELSSSSLAPAPVDRGRRHQIPGLRTTAFLKLYLLRCDDKDIYKSSSRKVLRQWLKEHVSDSQNGERHSGQENHDAFEWLILHVVLPDTVAAAQPRWSKKQGADESEVSKERSSNAARWPGRGSRTILEKLRADFNQSSKSALGRVSQIRLQRDILPEQLLNSLPSHGPSQYGETPQDRESAWSDLITNFKSLILSSFNLRVGQYEDDIRERDSQRAMPGWNFCTFFVLKEGLAKVFESVGLTEDSLVVYDELSVGLDTILRDQNSAEQQSQAPLLLACTPELRDLLVAMVKGNAVDSVQTVVPNTSFLKPLNINQKNYRSLIVSTSISLFDFQCYVFCRQMALLLRLARSETSLQKGNRSDTGAPFTALGSQGGTSEPSRQVEDAARLAALSQRAAQFVTSTARVLRDDLWKCGADILISKEVFVMIVEDLVSSWTFSALQQILDDTSSSILPTPSSMRNAKAGPAESQVKFPQRQSSLMTLAQAHRKLSEQAGEEREYFIKSLSVEDIITVQSFDLANFAALRADLILVQRESLNSLGERSGLLKHDALEKESTSSPPVKACNYDKLKTALSSLEEFRSEFEFLSDRAAWLYTIAGRKKSAERIIADLASMMHKTGDYAGAAMYFSRLVPHYMDKKWSSVGSSLLMQYADCLKALHRRDEYIRAVLALLASSAEEVRSHSMLGIYPSHRVRVSNLSSTLTEMDSWFSELVLSSETLPYDFSAPLDKYFEIMDIDPYIHLRDDMDGFRLSLMTRQLLADNITIDSIKVRLTSARSNQVREVWLESDRKLQLGQAPAKFWLTSNVTTLGELFVDKIMINAGKLLFVNEAIEEETNTTMPSRQPAVRATKAGVRGRRVLCYPRTGSLHALVVDSPTVHIGKIRSLDVVITSGYNNITACKLVIRSASAGLRLRTADTALVENGAKIEDKQRPGEIELGSIAAQTRTTLRIPYDVEGNLPELFLHLEVRYRTVGGEYIFLSDPTVTVTLLLSVNVQEIFREKAVFSQFWLQPLNETPIHLLSARLESSDWLHAEPALQSFSPLTIFTYQPTCITYKISQKDNPPATGLLKSKQPSLKICLEYRNIREDILSQAVSALERELSPDIVGDLSQLLLHAFSQALKRHLTFEICTSAGLMSEVSVPSFKDSQWTKTTKNLPKGKRVDLQQWLTNWHERNTVLRLLRPDDALYKEKYPARKLIIDFEIPRVPYLQTASIKLLDHHTPLAQSSRIAAVGEPLPAELRLRHTRRWDYTRNPTANADCQVDFIFEIDADREDWLISGQLQALYSAREDEELVFALVLIPLKPGFCLLPLIKIRTVYHNQSTNALDEKLPISPLSLDTAGHGGGLTCETHCLSESQGIVVIESLRSTTLALGESNVLTKRINLLESEARFLPITD